MPMSQAAATGEAVVAATDETVKLERNGDVAILTMCYAPHNLLGAPLANGIVAGLVQAETTHCRAVVLRSGLRHFSAGADLAMFENRGEAFNHGFDGLALLHAIENSPLPIIASVHGVALGGGLELALACDLVVAASSAKFGLVEATLGLHPLMGGIQRMAQRVGVARAKEIVMLARRFDAATFESWGVINRAVPDAQLLDVTMTLAQELATGPTIAHGCSKRLFNRFLDEGMAASDAAMAEIQAPIWASSDLAVGLRAFKEKGPGAARFGGN
jgi:enoyl-CoA hydratase/carnithine racemase